MQAWMGWAVVVEALMLSMFLALTLTWSALRAIFRMMPSTRPAPRLAPALATRQTQARAA